MKNFIIMAMHGIILFLAMVPICVIAYGKFSENIKSSEYMRTKLLENVINQLEKDIAKSEINNKYLQLGQMKNSYQDSENFMDYEDDIEETNIMPAIRDNEYLQHSTLWGAHYVSGGAGEGIQTLNPENPLKNKNEIKTDSTLPAYCNPPNPCPVGYTEEDGCIIDFENTAAFSREYQESQECMCDSEHMFDCGRANSVNKNNVDVDELVRKFQVEDEHKNLVAKKFHVKKAFNPYLQGEFLPIAAKKGIGF
ncbi:neuroendocrine protein 7B2-like [Daktulosphaira vitifoliae]|uniref:neuroendocrine protein 7B2-like n=1 Tax=Daktulosphaira vitifoliae TaxID=58002 RepID=UPI0021A9FA53|nr:neuroendocrine protein 7B2-like [Daktulosphaira vitifoliae]XP_050520353.1 neuroendocrine protein 7B2-like [Daktulosphaira vitifoliae]XP_050520354.1 neuroendocrine protein 7B2-like [Daktulosphaira vitifoliae]XP_050520355.1 neuroendocrine protein 7B2-like [Daktulosphaira vitifoliae]